MELRLESRPSQHQELSPSQEPSQLEADKFGFWFQHGSASILATLCVLRGGQSEGSLVSSLLSLAWLASRGKAHRKEWTYRHWGYRCVVTPGFPWCWRSSLQACTASTSPTEPYPIHTSSPDSSPGGPVPSLAFINTHPHATDKKIHAHK